MFNSDLEWSRVVFIRASGRRPKLVTSFESPWSAYSGKMTSWLVNKWSQVVMSGLDHFLKEKSQLTHKQTISATVKWKKKIPNIKFSFCQVPHDGNHIRSAIWVIDLNLQGFDWIRTRLANNSRYSQLGQKWVRHSWSALKVTPPYKFWVCLVKVDFLSISTRNSGRKIVIKTNSYDLVK